MSQLLRFARFAAVGVLGIGVQLTVLWVLVDALDVGYLLATGVAVSAAIVHNFFWHERWTWVDRTVPGRAMPTAFARFVLANGLVSLAGNTAVTAALVSATRLHPVAANAAAVGVCGLVNFMLADRVVFRRSPPEGEPALGLG
ncbi:MAG: hypothetical protein A3G76_01610 [Acidobacteria bacterium RIFCSPLOWO2_12_FULL_65_11]|nr:MAG: hypothetical protein A3H95_03525 [Acidobacteria bacterium RIFCSPLOWO2_02_FULL_64_15]OFW30421.1 MAG: hypothetical protein A3G76_01610 [Acidobacteria bacterium RIFCSPLOWO2_12_FULL_65_11]